MNKNDHTALPTYCLSVCPSVCPSLVRPSVFSFPDDNLSKCQWVFTKLDVCIDIVESWFEIVNGQISSILTELSALNMFEFSFPRDKLSKCQWIFTKLGVCIDIVKIWFGLLMGKFQSFLTELSARDMSPVFLFLDNNLSKYQWILPGLVYALH